MIIVLKKVAINNIKELLNFLESKKFEVNFLEENKVLYLKGELDELDLNQLKAFDAVEEVVVLDTPYYQVLRKCQKENTIIKVKDAVFGSGLEIIAGPCSVESKEQIDRIAKSLKFMGIKALRGGAYKPRTSPYTFQGLGEEALKYLKAVGDKYNLAIVSEIVSEDDLDLFIKYVDIIQVGTRNMQNYALLKKLGKIKKPILLKRGFASTVEEWLLAAEYLLSLGNREVILCERGIRSVANGSKATLDLNVIPHLKKISHLPVIVDPSHGTGFSEYVEPMSLAAVAAGADGLLIEVHHDPKTALSDGVQTLCIERFAQLLKKVKSLKEHLEEND
ncbi:MAG TPA: 3-deoxy-7-phosphoheptulonate synthase [Acholeplasma sp.]|jgi:3-deoxy-7-phosphoheptulonate synthase|nr:3-deoxy-7-phosphoheptulonate synthase [Acholeplasma sp.]